MEREGRKAKSKSEEPTNKGFWVSSGNRKQLVINNCRPVFSIVCAENPFDERDACSQLALHLEGMGKER